MSGARRQPSPVGSRRTRTMLISALCVHCAVAVASCGGDASQGRQTATVAEAPPAKAVDPPRVAETAVPGCDAAGINARVGRQGTCVIGGVTRTVTNRRQRLVLDDEIEIKLEDLAVRPRGSGRMVAASLRIRNLGDRRLRWPASARQVALWVDERLIVQDPRRRMLALQAVRPIGKRSVALAPGSVSTVAVGWRLPAAAAARLGRRGSAIIVVAPHRGGQSIDVATRIGVLRLWK